MEVTVRTCGAARTVTGSQHLIEVNGTPQLKLRADVLPADFTPRNTDGEIDEFFLWHWTQVAQTVERTRQFKFNCNLVLIDFFVRHGLLAPEHPDYLAICAGLRR